MAQKFASYTNNGTDQINFVGNTYFVKGTQTAATNAWTGTLPGNLSAYYDGLTIDYYLPYAGTSTAATLNLSSKGAKPVYYRGSNAVKTHYPAGSVIHLTYIQALNSNNGAWESTAWYDSNTTYTIGNGTLTIQKNGTSVGTFTANQTGNSTVNITTPSTSYSAATMSASNWNSTAKTYSFESSYPNATYNISVSIAPTATSAQIAAFGAATFAGSATTNVITALGTVPTVDIPIILGVSTK